MLQKYTEYSEVQKYVLQYAITRDETNIQLSFVL